MMLFNQVKWMRSAKYLVCRSSVIACPNLLVILDNAMMAHLIPYFSLITAREKLFSSPSGCTITFRKRS